MRMHLPILAEFQKDAGIAVQTACIITQMPEATLEVTNMGLSPQKSNVQGDDQTV